MSRKLGQSKGDKQELSHDNILVILYFMVNRRKDQEEEGMPK